MLSLCPIIADIRNHRLGWSVLVVSLLFTVENWLFGSASWMYGYGSGLETIPAFLGLAHGYNFSAWAPFAAGGVDRLAFWGNADPLSPEITLFSALPVWVANALHRTVQYGIGMYFTARVLTDCFHLDRRFAFAGGILFGCFSYFTVGALLTLPAVPLMIWALERLLQQSRGAPYFLGLGVAMSLATTFTFGVPYLLSFAVAWIVIVRCDFRLSTLWRLGVFALTLMFAELPQLLAVMANAPESHRAHWALEPITFSMDGLLYRQLQFDLFAQDKILSFITQDMPLPVLLLCGAVMIARRRRNAAHAAIVSDFLRVTGLFLLLAQKWLFLAVQALIAKALPWAGGIYMGRFFELPASFLIAIALTLAGRWMWLTMPSVRLHKTMVIGFSVFAMFMMIEPKRHLFQTLGIHDWGQANYQVTAIETLKQTTHHPFRVASVLPLQPAYAYAQGLETADGWANIYPRNYREIWLKILEPLYTELPAYRTFFGVDSGKAVDNFIFLGANLTDLLPGETAQDALTNGFDIDRRFRLDLLRLLNVEYLLSEYPLRGKGVELVHAPQAWPTALLSRDPNTGLANGEALANPGKQLLWNELMAANARKRAGKDIFIYRLCGAAPRVRLVQHVQQYHGSDDVLNAMVNLSGSELQTAVVSEDIAAIPNRLSTGTVTNYVSENDTRTMDVTTDQPMAGFLVVAENWSPFWQARVDELPVSVLRVNHTQIGVIILPGRHHVELIYHPFYKHWLDR